MIIQRAYSTISLFNAWQYKSLASDCLPPKNTRSRSVNVMKVMNIDMEECHRRINSSIVTSEQSTPKQEIADVLHEELFHLVEQLPTLATESLMEAIKFRQFFGSLDFQKPSIVSAAA